MKKLLISLGIAVVLLLGTFGAVILAAPPDNPRDDWTYIKDGVDELLDTIGEDLSMAWDTVFEALLDIFNKVDVVEEEVGYVQSDVEDLTDDVAGLQSTVNGVVTDVSNIQSDIDDFEGSIARITSAQDRFYAPETGDLDITDEYLYESPTFDQGAHFSVTVRIASATPSEKVQVNQHFGTSGSLGTAISNWEPGLYTFEFDAKSCSLTFTNDADDGDRMLFGWGVTITYAADSLAD